MIHKTETHFRCFVCSLFPSAAFIPVNQRAFLIKIGVFT